MGDRKYTVNPWQRRTPTGTVNRQQWCEVGKDQDTQAEASTTPECREEVSSQEEGREEGSSHTGEEVPHTLAPGQEEGSTAGSEACNSSTALDWEAFVLQDLDWALTTPSPSPQTLHSGETSDRYSF